ncbi:hypothetical protein MUK70_25980 [Dyadobacter chenwenxiniae]|uniref:Uncharacterized protein n=1 Tax=Dyadobacter chenwenxiniae TaxID=2906456 RepID=A0A9X1PND6_9BACT|nr:hypothetical protein [Dyadobacter chenwenxiniae]MCF0064320.1 hypothetical protein [Dyadobacter chenwenxiniae]UON82469.1 hypothetical protein MUK70_25980 [Dyadobacter chenwenxiniae]
MSKILIIGRIPPPIGGVTMHVSRLLESLTANGFQHFSFCDLANESPYRIIKKIVKHRSIHLHISNPFFQFLLATFCLLTRKKLLLTYHGNWGRYGMLGNGAVKLSAWLCSIPIVQNKESLVMAKHFNRNALLISTFIPPTHTIPVDPQLAQQLNNFRKRFKFVFCTNAWNLVFDKNGRETYGISHIISSMRNVNFGGLIISDPSGNYQPFINRTLGLVPDNVIFIEGPHDFGNVLHMSDAFIRNTTTDGVSLSIYEAHERNVVVLASANASRADFCNVYRDISTIDLVKALEKGRSRLQNGEKTAGPNVTNQLIRLYKHCIELNFRLL